MKGPLDILPRTPWAKLLGHDLTRTKTGSRWVVKGPRSPLSSQAHSSDLVRLDYSSRGPPRRSEGWSDTLCPKSSSASLLDRTGSWAHPSLTWQETRPDMTLTSNGPRRWGPHSPYPSQARASECGRHLLMDHWSVPILVKGSWLRPTRQASCPIRPDLTTDGPSVLKAGRA